MLTVLSLGGGVQSSTLALMAARGELPMPDCAVFADTLAESRPTYDWLDWLIPRLPYPVYQVMTGSVLLANVLQPLRQGSRAALPAYTESPDGIGQLRRQCTSQFKHDPINARFRHLLGLRPHQRNPKAPAVVKWLGISLDEVERLKPAPEPWVETRWPLIDLRMSRLDCLLWLVRHGYPKPPRSACVCCPYRSDREWRTLRDTDPEGWARALEVDNLLHGGIRGNSRPLYLHRSCKPLIEVDLSTPQERGQLSLFDDHGDLCDGHCYV